MSFAQAAVVGYEHPIKGQGIYAFVSLMEGYARSTLFVLSSSLECTAGGLECSFSKQLIYCLPLVAGKGGFVYNSFE